LRPLQPHRLPLTREKSREIEPIFLAFRGCNQFSLA
jgi:hypothetical protein